MDGVIKERASGAQMVTSEASKQKNLTSHFSGESTDKIAKGGSSGMIKGANGSRYKPNSSSQQQRHHYKMRKKEPEGEKAASYTSYSTSSSSTFRHSDYKQAAERKAYSSGEERTGSAALIREQPKAEDVIRSSEYNFQNNTSRIKSDSALLNRTINGVYAAAETALSRSESQTDDVATKAVYAVGKGRLQEKAMIPRALTSARNTAVVARNVVVEGKKVVGSINDVGAASYLRRKNGKTTQDSEDLRLAKEKLKGVLSSSRKNVSTGLSQRPGISKSVSSMIRNYNASGSEEIGVQSVIKTKDTVMQSSRALKAAVTMPKKSVRAVKKARDKIYKAAQRIKGFAKGVTKLFSNPVTRQIMIYLCGAALIVIIIVSVFSVISSIISNLDFLNQNSRKEEKTYKDNIRIVRDGIDSANKDINEVLARYDLGSDLYNRESREQVNVLIAANVVIKQNPDGIDTEVDIKGGDVWNYLVEPLKVRRIIYQVFEAEEEGKEPPPPVIVDDTTMEMKSLVHGGEFPESEYEGKEGYVITYGLEGKSLKDLMQENYNVTDEELDRFDLILIYFDEQLQDTYEECLEEIREEAEQEAKQKGSN